jgi:hypothetical protein
MKLTLTRTCDDGVQTLGVLRLPNGAIYQTLELAWKNNEKQISCIPAESYKVVKRNSPKYGNHFHIKDVPNRSWVLIHHGNYHSDILGCILVGKGLKDINNDGLLDVTSSKIAMGELNAYLPNDFELEIIYA